MEPSYAAIQMASYTEVSDGWVDFSGDVRGLVFGGKPRRVFVGNELKGGGGGNSSNGWFFLEGFVRCS